MLLSLEYSFIFFTDFVFISLNIGPFLGFCVHGDGNSGCIKGQLLDQRSKYQFPQKDSSMF
jgi:hypothetical protein